MTFPSRLTASPLARAAALAASLALPLPAAATSLEACLKDLEKHPAAEVAQGYAARLSSEKMTREASFWSNYCVGRAWNAAGELKKAAPALRTAAKLAKTAEERSGAQSFLGATLYKMNRLSEAETATRAAMAAAREAGNTVAQAEEMNNLGIIAAERKHYDQAINLYNLSHFLQSDESKKATVLQNMAALYSQKGDLELAVEAYQQAIAIDRRVGDQRNLMTHTLNLGDAYRKLRQWKNCSSTLDEGLALARANGDRYWEATGLQYRGDAFGDNGEPVKAREFLHAALLIFREIGAKGDVADVENTLRGLK